MKHLFLLLLIPLIFLSCKKEKIVISGHWIDKKTGLTYNPYPAQSFGSSSIKVTAIPKKSDPAKWMRTVIMSSRQKPVR
jgi:hypothetical protein